MCLLCPIDDDSVGNGSNSGHYKHGNDANMTRVCEILASFTKDAWPVMRVVQHAVSNATTVLSCLHAQTAIA